MRELIELVGRVAELERRFASFMRHGTVEEVDAAKQLVRIRMGEPKEGGQPFVGPWVPYGQIAGALKVHTPPSKGQQMTMINPTGDFRQAVAIPLTWSDQNASPSDKPDEHVLTFEDVKVTIKKGSVTVKVGDHELELKPEGSKFKEGYVKHDDAPIDKNHKHKDVEPGPALTGPPEAGV